MNTKKKVYTDWQAENFLRKYVPVAQSQLVKTVSDIKIKTPLVLKIISPDVLHKSDIGGVRFVFNSDDLEKNFESLIRIANRKNIRLDGIMAQEYHEGQQIIIGIKKDQVFGHVILFGLGGIFTEVLEDTAIRKCPITFKDAEDMMDELKASKIFHGFRGIKLNIDLLKKVLVKVSQIPKRHKTIQELDINPFILNKDRGVVADARIIFSSE